MDYGRIGMWTGEELQYYLSNWDFTYEGNFTGTERNQMYRASMGDYNWMYDKHDNPRAGWINLWNRRGDEIYNRYQKATQREERIQRREERGGMSPGKMIAYSFGAMWIIGLFGMIIQAIAA